MDRDQFDRLSRLIAIAGTRRDALRVLIVGAVAGAAAVAPTGAEDAAARERRKGGKRKVGAQQVPVACLVLPSTCSLNCDSKPLRGGANLSKCNLSGRDLDGVKLNGANLSKTCFSETSLRNADLRGTNLSGSCLCGADLTGADFRGSNVTAAQLACATVACNTILPNGKPAVVCPSGRTCCNGVCTPTGSDPNNCGACGVRCGVCQFCNFGRCETLADLEFDCTGAPLERIGRETVCTAGPETGICDGGICNCGPRGVYVPEANVCLCNQGAEAICAARGECCELTSTCVEAGSFSNATVCLGCTPP